jgi:nitrogen fixation protein NifB
MPLDLTQHPCFNSDVRHTTGRIHLPVAPKCNIQCNYCDRKFDCMNESRPGVTSAVLQPRQALAYLDKVLERVPQLKVVGIAGPGDPFATPDETLETLRLVREKYPEMLLCVASNGLNLAPYADDLARLQVSHVTITVNTVDPAIGAKIYSWVRDHKTIYRGEEGARILLERQLASIKALKAAGVTLKINTILVPGINEEHVAVVAEEMRALGADVMNCIPLYPVTGTPFADKTELPAAEVKKVRAEISKIIPQMEHCSRCRADAVGLLGADQSLELVNLMRDSANGLLDDRAGRPYVAVASMEGILINQHLGEAEKLWIFEYDEINPKLVAMRDAPPAGDGNQRWRELAKTIEDCHSILVSGVGRAPRWVMEDSGLRVIEASGLIAQAMESLHRSGDVPVAMKKQFKSCGSSECQGTGTGCS